jgi:hypothetical protein
LTWLTADAVQKLVVVWFILVASNFVAVVVSAQKMLQLDLTGNGGFQLQLCNSWNIVYSLRPTQPTQETKYKKVGVESWKQEESSRGLHLTETRAVNMGTGISRSENGSIGQGETTKKIIKIDSYMVTCLAFDGN